MWFLSDAPSTVVALVLWLILELVSLACINGVDHAPFLEELLTKVSLSAAQRMLLMSMMRTWLHEIKVCVHPLCCLCLCLFFCLCLFLRLRLRLRL